MDDLENMKPLSDDSDLTTCFLFKLSTNSPEILQFLVHSINDLGIFVFFVIGYQYH